MTRLKPFPQLNFLKSPYKKSRRGFQTKSFGEGGITPFIFSLLAQPYDKGYIQMNLFAPPFPPPNSFFKFILAGQISEGFTATATWCECFCEIFSASCVRFQCTEIVSLPPSYLPASDKCHHLIEKIADELKIRQDRESWLAGCNASSNISLIFHWQVTLNAVVTRDHFRKSKTKTEPSEALAPTLSPR